MLNKITTFIIVIMMSFIFTSSSFGGWFTPDYDEVDYVIYFAENAREENIKVVKMSPSYKTSEAQIAIATLSELFLRYYKRHAYDPEKKFVMDRIQLFRSLISSAKKAMVLEQNGKPGCGEKLEKKIRNNFYDVISKIDGGDPPNDTDYAYSADLVLTYRNNCKLFKDVRRLFADANSHSTTYEDWK